MILCIRILLLQLFPTQNRLVKIKSSNSGIVIPTTIAIQLIILMILLIRYTTINHSIAYSVIPINSLLIPTTLHLAIEFKIRINTIYPLAQEFSLQNLSALTQQKILQYRTTISISLQQ